jgi:hypothetical protein
MNFTKAMTSSRFPPRRPPPGAVECSEVGLANSVSLRLSKRGFGFGGEQEIGNRALNKWKIIGCGGRAMAPENKSEPYQMDQLDTIGEPG